MLWGCGGVLAIFWQVAMVGLPGIVRAALSYYSAFSSITELIFRVAHWVLVQEPCPGLSSVEQITWGS